MRGGGTAMRAVAAIGRRRASHLAAAGAGTQVHAEVADGGRGIVLRCESSERALHHLWLRERTTNPERLHVESNQRLFEACDLLDTPQAVVEDVHVAGDALHVRFGDGSEDTFGLERVVAEAFNPAAVPALGNQPAQGVNMALPEPSPWTPDMPFDFDRMGARHAYGEVATSDDGLRSFLDSLWRWGAAIISDAPRDQKAYKEFLLSFGRLRDTNWGPWFEVVAAPQAEEGSDASIADVAFSSLAIPLHTDGPYNTNPLEFQVLQCLKQSAVGGESTLSDGLGAAEALRVRDPAAFELLATVPVRFRYADAANELLTERPILSLRSDGAVDKVFYSGRLDAVPAFGSLESMEAFYRARQLFLEELYRPGRLADFKLERNDLLIFNNSRLLHGRSAFDASTATPPTKATEPAQEETEEDAGVDLSNVSRYLRGCYLEGLDNKYRVLKRRMARGETTTPHGVRAFSTSPARSVASSGGGGGGGSGAVSPAFPSLDAATEDDVRLMTELYADAATGQKLADRALGLFKLLNQAHAGEHDNGLGIPDAHLGSPVDLYEHGLQTATRCLRDGCSEEVVVAGLLHDIGELLSPSNHGEFSAALLRPYVSPHVSWMLEHHEVFQMYYYAHKSEPKMDREARKAYLGSGPQESHGVRVGDKEVNAYDFTVAFCDKYDQASFDRNYPSEDLSAFVPAVRRVFSREAYWHSPSHPKRGAVTGAAA